MIGTIFVKMIGQVELTMQDCGDNKRVLEIGYLLKKRYWHKGYATEAAIACENYVYTKLHASWGIFNHS